MKKKKQSNLGNSDEKNESVFEEAVDNVYPPHDIVAFNELRTCADLYRMYEAGYLEIQPTFQRGIVWSENQQTKFIDSVMKNLPIPSMCFSVDYSSTPRKWMVIDGLQRINSIIRFLNPKSEWVLSKLSDINPEIAGKDVKRFHEKGTPLSKYYQYVEDLLVPINVIRCEYSKESHMDYIFTIFQRLNSGGKRLTNQDIRRVMFQGELNDTLEWFADFKDKNELKSWRMLCKFSRIEKDLGSKIQEIVLRFFALNKVFDEYQDPMVKFLNKFMSKYTLLEKHDKELVHNECEQFKELLIQTSEILSSVLADEHYKKGGSILKLEAALIGVSKNLNALKSASINELREKYDRMIQSEEFDDVWTKEGTLKKDKVIGRIEAAIRAFG